MIDPDALAKLLLVLEAVGVRKLIPEGDNLRLIPVVAISPDLLAQVKAHKADLLAALRPMFVPAGVAPRPDPPANWVLRPDSRGVMGWQSPDAPVPFSAWEDRPEHSQSARADPAAGPCWWCGRRGWWRSVAWPDVVRCGWCHPPASGSRVEWLNREVAATE